MWKYFSFIHFRNPLYISTQNDPKFVLTSGTARNLIIFAIDIRIYLWTRLNSQLIHFEKSVFFGTG